MASGASKSEQPTEHDSGVGRIRERTIVLGDTLIAIDNIGSIQILDVKRGWTLARWGAVIVLVGIGALLAPSNPYSSSGSPGPVLGMALVGVGLVMTIANWLGPLRKGLAIGTADGRLSYVVSADHGFLNRLLEFLTLKINTRNEALTASFDITNTTINTNGGGLVIGADGVASGTGGFALGDGGSVSVTNNTPPPLIVAPSPMSAPVAAMDRPPRLTALIDPDEALFADEPQAAPAPPPLKPRAEAPKPVRAAAIVRTRPHDPLLDGPDAGANDDDDRDWLRPPGRADYTAEPDRGGAGWLLPLVLLLLVGGGGVTGWYFYSQSQTSTAVSLIPTMMDADSATAAEPESAPLAESSPSSTLGDAASTIPAETPAFLPAITELSAATTSAVGPGGLPVPGPESAPFTPPETVVARASGLRYRGRPSSSDDVPIIAETIAGGEVLLVNGVSTQPDGEWYRVALPGGRAAWFKASLTVPRSQFAETFSTNAAAQALTFAATSPRILEPAEGVQVSGGAQPVRLAWQGPSGASIHIVEIQAYDPAARRWIENPLHKRVIVNSEEELAELIPRTGAWRWRVRGVSADGEQSQFSRWAAFGIRE